MSFESRQIDGRQPERWPARVGRRGSMGRTASLDDSKTRSWTNFRLGRNPIATEAEPEAFPADGPLAEDPTRTFFEAGAVFEGSLKLQGDFRIESEFRGRLSTDGVIVVGLSGSVEGDIEARQIEIDGAVVGNVTASRLVILRATGRLHGDVETACLEIERHAVFRGRTQMVHPLSTPRPLTDASREIDETADPSASRAALAPPTSS